MPAMHYRLRWPDRTETRCYSPSSVITQYFAAGEKYPIGEFLQRAQAATDAASERVRAKFGYACSLAHDQWCEIELRAEQYRDDPDAKVEVIGFDAFA